MKNNSYMTILFQVHSQDFRLERINALCPTEHIEFPKFSLHSTSSEEDKLSELYKIFHYMNTSMGNITEDQMDLNPNNKILHQQLNTSKAEIAAVISNLSCVLDKWYKVPKIDMYYTVKYSKTIMLKKIKGCKVLRKYKHFLTQAAEITSDWEKKGEYTQEPSSGEQTPGHR